jgi:hypothetical protein
MFPHILGLSVPLLNHLTKHCSWIEKLALRWTCKPFYQEIVHESARDLIFRRMKEMFETNDLLLLMERGYFLSIDNKQILLGSDPMCRISGSFLLQCIYEQNWKSDIDVYSMPFLSPKSDKKYEPCREPKHSEYCNLSGKSDFTYYCEHAYLNAALEPLPSDDTNENFHLNWKLIKPGNHYEDLPIYPRLYRFQDKIDVNDIRLCQNQTMFTSVTEFVDMFFDIEICKVVYTPSTGKFIVRNMDHLFTRTTTVSLDTNKYCFLCNGSKRKCNIGATKRAAIRKVYSRIVKYECRGFSFSNKDAFLDVYNI